MSKEKEPPSPTFMGTFIGSLVDATGMVGGEPISVNGFLLDIDEDYLYFGPDQETVLTAIRRENITIISLHDENDDLHDMLKRVEGPKTPQEIN